MPREIARGAEAVIEEVLWFGEPAVRKRRIPKGYRKRELDAELRRLRTRAEAKLMIEARAAGFPTPHVYDVDIFNTSITMELVQGQTMKDFINQCPEEAGKACFDMGRFVGILHAGEMVHGDLTTSNVMLSSMGLVFIDMGMGGKAGSIEELGVDLHLVKEALESTHNHIPGLYARLLEGYRTTFADADLVVDRARTIESRGRYM